MTWDTRKDQLLMSLAYLRWQDIVRRVYEFTGELCTRNAINTRIGYLRAKQARVARSVSAPAVSLNRRDSQYAYSQLTWEQRECIRAEHGNKNRRDICRELGIPECRYDKFIRSEPELAVIPCAGCRGDRSSAVAKTRARRAENKRNEQQGIDGKLAPEVYVRLAEYDAAVHRDCAYGDEWKLYWHIYPSPSAYRKHGEALYKRENLFFRRRTSGEALYVGRYDED